MNVGDRVKVIDQDITGVIERIDGYSLSLIDDDSEWEYPESLLEYRVYEVKPLGKMIDIDEMTDDELTEEYSKYCKTTNDPMEYDDWFVGPDYLKSKDWMDYIKSQRKEIA